MKKLILILIIITSCSSELLEEIEYIGCNCRLKTEEFKVVNSGGVYTTKLITTFKPYESNDCDLKGTIRFQSNTITKTIVCE